MLEYVRAFGRGPGIVGFAYFVVSVLALMQLRGQDIAAWSGPVGIIVGGFYGGSVMKAATDAWRSRNGGNQPANPGR